MNVKNNFCSRSSKFAIMARSHHIKDYQVKDAFRDAVIKNKFHLARIITEELREHFPEDENYRSLDTLITEICIYNEIS